MKGSPSLTRRKLVETKPSRESWTQNKRSTLFDASVGIEQSPLQDDAEALEPFIPFHGGWDRNDGEDYD